MNHIKSILLAEDNVLIAQLYQTALTAYGFSVQMAFDGEEVMTHLNGNKQHPDLLLLDLLMPKLNGYDIIKRVKHDPALKNIPIVVLTNLSDQHDADQALELGAALYMVKNDYTPIQLVMKIKEVLADPAHDADSKFETNISPQDVPLSRNNARISKKSKIEGLFFSTK